MHKKTTQLMLLAGDLLAVMLSFLIAAIITVFVSHDVIGQGRHDLVDMITDKKRFSFFMLMSVLAVTYFYHRGHYTRRIPWLSQVNQIIICFAMILLIDGFAHYAVKYQFSRLWLFFSWTTAAIMVLFARRIVKIIACRINMWNLNCHIIGHGDNLVDTLYAISSDSYIGYQIKTIIINKDFAEFDKSHLPPAYHDVQVRSNEDNIEQLIFDNNGDFFIFASDDFDAINHSSNIPIIRKNNIEHAIVPPIKGIRLYNLEPYYFFGHDVMLLQNHKRINSLLGKAFKRMFDIIVSLLLIIITAPIMSFIFYKLTQEGGNVIFRQNRVGKNGKMFVCLKFRSMIPNAEQVLREILEQDEEMRKEWEKYFKLTNDPRITKTGKFIRNTSLDELPQLFNVLKGEMSLVGPRPILEWEQEFYGERLRYYISVCPGITGLWQVSGRSDITFQRRTQIDSWYVQNWSLWHDVVILFKTIKTVLAKSGAR